MVYYYHGYLNIEFICHGLLNRFLNYTYLIFVEHIVLLLKEGGVFLTQVASELRPVVHHA